MLIKPFKQIGKVALGWLIALTGGSILAIGAMLEYLPQLQKRTLVIKDH